MKKFFLILLALLLCISLAACALFENLQPESNPPEKETLKEETQIPDSSEEKDPDKPVEENPQEETTDPVSGEEGKTDPANPATGEEGKTDPESGETHTHEFTQKVASAEYDSGDGKNFYYSCSCGAKGSETFYRSINISEDPYEPGYWGPIIHGQ